MIKKTNFYFTASRENKKKNFSEKYLKEKFKGENLLRRKAKCFVHNIKPSFRKVFIGCKVRS